MKGLTVAWIGAALLASCLRAQPRPSYETAASLFQEGRLADAETELKAILKHTPKDPQPWMLMGVVLDSGERYGEAESYYQRALALAPKSTAILNNFGNHYLAAGDAKEAERYYRRVTELAAHHANANLHLAEMRVADKRGVEALEYLEHLPESERVEPVPKLLRGQALALLSRCDEAVALLEPLEERAGMDARFSFSMGLAYASCKRFDRAEVSFSRALESHPRDFDVLYNLALAARGAAHMDRARQLFEVALKQKPNDADALYGLADVLACTGEKLMATAQLYRLERLAPARVDVILLLAHTTDELGYFEEAARTYDRYLTLRPEDKMAKRELGFALVRSGNTAAGLPKLQEYVEAHAEDPVGQYELAIGEAYLDAEKAIRRLDRAVSLDPNLFPPRYARAVLSYQEGRLPQAVEDFQFLAERNPGNAQLLDWLGRAALSRDHAEEAAGFLKRALDLAPGDRAILMHYSAALRMLGRREEVARVLAAFHRSSSSDGGERRIRRGLFEFLDLPPEEQRARSLQSLEAAAAANPDDFVLKTRWAGTLLEEGRTAQGVTAFREILAHAPNGEVAGECGRILMRHEQYGLAAEFLKSAPGAGIDLAIATFHATGAEAGLAALGKIPPAERRGDYHLLHAQILDALGKPEQAAEALNRGIGAAPERPGMYFQAAVFLIKHGRHQEAAQLLGDAARLLPGAPELLLGRAIALELLKRTDEAVKVLAQIQRRWPEWDRPYLIHGIILQSIPKPAEARQMLETAIALGAREADAYYFLALAITYDTPEKPEDALGAILEAVRLNPNDSGIRWLAGKVLLDSGQYQRALEQAAAVVRLDPTSIRGHHLLLNIYRELGEKEKAVAEAKWIERLHAENPNPAPPETSSIERVLFSVRPRG